MRLMIRFADKIVGVSVILALGIVVFVMLTLLAVNQRWFSRDYSFHTYLDSAAGLNPYMPVQHLGFNIGQVRYFEPTDDERVRVGFVVFEEYRDRAREGSRIELIVSPIPVFGSQFLFHPGESHREPLAEGATIPGVREYDAIGGMIDDIGSIISIVNLALGGTDETVLGRTLMGVEDTIAALRVTMETISEDVAAGLGATMANVDRVLANVAAISDGLAAPDGAVMSILDGEGAVYASLIDALEAVSGTIRNVEEITALIPAQFPQIVALLVELQSVLRTADDALVAVTNLPIVRRGAPTRAETGPGGTFARDMEF